MSLPPWAIVTPERRAHIERVASLLDAWAARLAVDGTERARWLRAARLHDALRDAPLTTKLAHGPAAADRAAREGETDRGVLDAVRYHTVGYVGWDDVGRMLYLADFLDPGRTFGPDERRGEMRCSSRWRGAGSSGRCAPAGRSLRKRWPSGTRSSRAEPRSVRARRVPR